MYSLNTYTGPRCPYNAHCRRFDCRPAIAAGGFVPTQQNPKLPLTLGSVILCVSTATPLTCSLTSPCDAGSLTPNEGTLYASGGRYSIATHVHVLSANACVNGTATRSTFPRPPFASRTKNAP